MGNRAVIVSADTTRENANKKIGVYVHWFGSRDEIEHALEMAAAAKIRTISSDNQYFWARFCQVFADYITTETGETDTGIGIDIVANLDCHNYDNGVYYINDNFEIEKQTDGQELAGATGRVWLVNQTQPGAEYYDKTVFVYDDHDKAQAKARELNKEYGDCCDFTPDGDFIQVKDDCYFDNAHYYTVESKNIK